MRPEHKRPLHPGMTEREYRQEDDWQGCGQGFGVLVWLGFALWSALCIGFGMLLMGAWLR